jgi:hypothetical protein
VGTTPEEVLQSHVKSFNLLQKSQPYLSHLSRKEQYLRKVNNQFDETININEEANYGKFKIKGAEYERKNRGEYMRVG